MDRTVYDRIVKTRDILAPTGVALQLLESARQDTATIEAFTGVMETDPVIASALVELVNLPLPGLTRQVPSVSEAAAQVDIKTLAHLALGFSLMCENRKGACTAFDYELFWSESLGTAVATRRLAHHLRCADADEAFACGLLSQVGRLALATAFPDSYSDALKVIATDDRNDLCEIERAVFGIDHCVYSSGMLSDWGFSDWACDAVRVQLNPDEIVVDADSRSQKFAQLLQLAGSIASAMLRSPASLETLSALAVTAQALGIERGVFRELFDSICQEWQEAGTLLSVTTCRVPSLAGIQPDIAEGCAMPGSESGCQREDNTVGDRLYAGS